jgi:hypothetical protein
MAGLGEQRLGTTRKGEPSLTAMRQAYTVELAPLVRGSSRRIHDHVGRDQTLIHEYQSDQPSANRFSAFARMALPGKEVQKSESRY